MISIAEIEEKSTFEGFLRPFAQPLFLQSWAWGEFQKSLGRKLFRLGVYRGKDLIGISQIYEEKSKIGSFFYCAGGPIFKKVDSDIVSGWTAQIEKKLKKAGGSFLRIDPRKFERDSKKIFLEKGFVEAAGFVQPEATAMIDLSKSEEELRHDLSSSTRYNINSAARKGVQVREGKEGEISIFTALLENTAQRKHLNLPSEGAYHLRQFKVLSEEGLMKLYIAEVGKEALSAALVVNYAGISYYLHAANSLERKELRASYPLVWHTIIEAKKARQERFDFWGVSPNDDSAHPWSGVTSFKLSFGARKEYYEKPLDLPLAANYQLMKAVEIWRRPVKKLLMFGRSAGKSK